ncbi:AMP-binding protein [Massilia sp. DWR3-1-1]|uniref:AMP-binding protein n=1 Tax=Massilia sp. DWR3-1-1 TaxID=2804559 RepID=UPI003CEBA87C
MFEPRKAAQQFLCGPKSLSYGELEDGIAQVAAYLIARGLAGQRILFAVADDHNLAPLLLGCLRAGALPLLIDPGMAPRQVSDIVALNAVDGVIADAALLARWSETGMALPARQVRVSAAAPKGLLLGKLLGRRASAEPDSWPGLLSAPKGPPLPPPRQHGSAYVVFTSGSTARPKGVEMGWPALNSHLDTIARHYDLQADARLLNLMPLSHGDGLVQGLLLAYRCGITLVRPAPFSIVAIESILIAIYRERVSHLVAAPTALALLQQYGGHLADNFANEHFRFAISCSAPLSEAVWRAFSERFKVKLINTYGLSETGACGLYAGPDAASHKIGSVGMPRDMLARILRADGSEAGPDEAGQLCLQGANLMTGYLDDPDATARALIDGWLHTGDQARCDGDGVYWIVGRIKELIICGGYNVSPEAINGVLMLHPAVQEAATLGLPDALWGEIPVAFVVLRPGQQADAASLLAHCALHLGAHELPKKIRLLAALPRTPSGKVIVAQLQQELGQEGAATSAAGDLHAQIFELAAGLFHLAPGHLRLDSGPANTAGWDSLAHINFVIALESLFSIRLSPSDVVHMDSMDATIDLVKRRLA